MDRIPKYHKRINLNRVNVDVTSIRNISYFLTLLFDGIFSGSSSSSFSLSKQRFLAVSFMQRFSQNDRSLSLAPTKHPSIPSFFAEVIPRLEVLWSGKIIFLLLLMTLGWRKFTCWFIIGYNVATPG